MELRGREFEASPGTNLTMLTPVQPIKPLPIVEFVRVGNRPRRNGVPGSAGEVSGPRSQRHDPLRAVQISTIHRVHVTHLDEVLIGDIRNALQNPSSYRHSAERHRWFRMFVCHAGGPGSIPGRCTIKTMLR
ncbi:hypothetical protein L596_030669 [Steinernema carpocapsae]|uniref:Uncharacterized protein n=1 Tax=Steinernema carpocapsae TaxID=34508 RepID=A0A4V5ZX16_STECR|nr:hypothetical protein L596_030669 [Steinernema carpocapsae]